MSAVMNATETDVVTETKQMLKEGGVTVDQRRKAKEMVKFFKQQRSIRLWRTRRCLMDAQERDQQRQVDHVRLLVGMMTEYATGVDFIDQIKLTISVLGIADIYD